MALTPFDGELDPPSGLQPFDGRLDGEKSGILRRGIGDTAVSLGKGVIGAGEGLVGLASLATGGAAGRLAEQAGFRPKEAKGMLDEFYSPEQQAANRAVSEAKGVGGTLASIAQNPSVVPQFIAESLPSMLGGQAIAKGGLKAAGLVGEAITPTAARLAGAAGEGAITAGSVAETIRQEAPDGNIYAAVPAGIMTGVLGVAGGKLANRLGLGDIDTALLTTANRGTASLPKRVIGGAISEGLLEEAPQSAQEQAFTNLGTGKPLMEGVPEAAALGGVLGSAMGGGFGVLSKPAGPLSRAAETATATGAAQEQQRIAADQAALDQAGKGAQAQTERSPQGPASEASAETTGQQLGSEPAIPASQPGIQPIATAAPGTDQSQQTAATPQQDARTSQSPLGLPQYSGPTLYTFPDGSTTTDPLAIRAAQEAERIAALAPQPYDAPLEEAHATRREQMARAQERARTMPTTNVQSAQKKAAQLTQDTGVPHTVVPTGKEIGGKPLVIVQEQSNGAIPGSAPAEVAAQGGEAQGIEPGRSAGDVARNAAVGGNGGADAQGAAPSLRPAADVRDLAGGERVDATQAQGTRPAGVETGPVVGVERPVQPQPEQVPTVQSSDVPGNAQAPDVSGKTADQLAYLSTNGQPGWKEAAQAEIARRQTGTPAGQQTQAAPDLAAINVPLSQRGNIDADLDRYKREQAAQAKQDAKTATAQRKVDKARAKELFAQHGEAIIAQHGAKFGDKETRKTLDSMVKWEPAKFIQLAETFQKEQAAQPTPAAPVQTQAAPTAEQAIRNAWRANEGKTIGSWHPLTVEHNGIRREFLANQKKLGDGKREAAIHLVSIRNGRLLASDPVGPLAYYYKLDGKNNLVEEGIPSRPTELQLKKWRSSGLSASEAPAQQGQPNAQPAPSPAVPAGEAVDAAQPKQVAGETQAPAGEKGSALVKVRTINGNTVHVRQSDLDSPSETLQTIRAFTADGKPKGRIHRENLDPDGSKQAASNQGDADNPLFDVVTAKGGKTFANTLAAARERKKRGLVESHGIVPAGDVQAGLSGFLLKRNADSKASVESLQSQGEPSPSVAPQNSPEQTEQPKTAPAVEVGKAQPSKAADISQGESPQPDAKNRELSGGQPEQKASQDAHAIVREVAKARPFDSFDAVRDAALDAVKVRTGKRWNEHDGTRGSMMADPLTDAIHDGQHAGKREYASTLPVSISEAGISVSEASQAFSGTSFSPERRGASLRRGVFLDILGLWKRLERMYNAAPADRQEAFVASFNEAADRYKGLVRGYLAAHSRVMSSMITGPARFPTEANRKRSDAADNRLREASDYINKAAQRLSKVLRGRVDNSLASQLAEAETKLSAREAAQARMKAVNAAHAKFQKDPTSLDKSVLSDADKQLIRAHKPRYSWEPHPFAPYELSNNNAEVRRLRDRVEELKRRDDAAQAQDDEAETGPVRMVRNADLGRLQLFFDGKPSEAVRDDLKAAAFKWAPSSGAWQRQLTGNAETAAKQIIAKHFPATETQVPAQAESAVEAAAKEDDAGPAVFRLGDADSASPSVFSFAGQNANTANGKMLEDARRLLARGEDPEEVRRATGWFVGKDGKYRFEISDNDASLKDVTTDPERYADWMDEAQSRATGVPLGQILHHPALFAAYPRLQGLRVRIIDKSLMGNSVGSFDAEMNMLSVVDPFDSTHDVLSTLLHEIQHGIQSIEGFASGGSPKSSGETADPNIHKELYAAISAYRDWWRSDKAIKLSAKLPVGLDSSANDIDEWYERLESSSLTSDHKREGERLLANIENERARIFGTASEMAAMDKYSRLAGEVEARNVQARQSMTDAERRATSPNSTVDTSDVIVMFNGKVMRNAPMVANLRSNPEAAPMEGVVSREAANGFLRDFLASFPGAPKVAVVDRVSDLPPDVRRDAGNQGGQSVKGALNHRDGRVYVVVGNHTSLADFQATVFHEVLGHAGVRALFGKDFVVELNKLFLGLGGGQGLRRIMEQRGMGRQFREYVEGITQAQGKDPKTWTDAVARSVLTEEVFAHVAEQPKLMDRMKALIGQVRDWLRRHGFAELSSLGETDILFLLQRARATLKQGNTTTLRNGVEVGPKGMVDAAGRLIAREGSPEFDALKVLADKLGLSEQAGATVFRIGTAEAFNPTFSKAGEVLSDVINTHGSFGLLKGLKTQYHKATLNPLFKGFWERSNAMAMDSARAMSRPADLAPRILPKFDPRNMGEAVKAVFAGRSDVQPADLKAVADALNSGTLDGGPSPTSGHAWTRAELTTPMGEYVPGSGSDGTPRTGRGLTEKQADLYEEARAAVDASLDELATATAWKVANQAVPGSALRDEIASDPQSAPAILAGVLEFAIGNAKDELRLLKQEKADPKAIEDQEKVIDGLEKDRAAIAAIFDKAEELKQAGYMPLMRFGKYRIAVTMRENGKETATYVGRYESHVEANRARRDLEQRFNGPGFTVGPVQIENENAWKMFKGVNPETVMLFAEEAGIKADDVMQEWYREAVSSRSALRRMIHRTGVEGYSDDLPRVLASFITSNGKQAGYAYHLGDMQEMLQNPDMPGDVQEEAQALLETIQEPNEKGATMRGLMATWYLLGSVGAALVNSTQTVTMSIPWLSQFGSKGFSATEAASAMGKAYKMVLKPITMPADLKAAMKRAEQNGIVDSNEVFHLYAESMKPMISKLGSGNLAYRARAFMTLWGAPFAMVETLNRRATFAAAYGMAKAQGKTEAQASAFAEKAVIETQGIYAKHNRPNWTRGTIGAAALTFKQFAVAYLEMLSRMAKNGPEGKKAALLALGVMFALAGASGLPGEDDLLDAIDTFSQIFFGKPTISKMEIRNFLNDNLGKELGGFINSGVSNFLPVDVSSRLGMGNLIPGTGIFKPSTKDKTGELIEIVGGVQGGFVQSMIDSVRMLAEGNVSGAVKTAAPKAIQDLAKGAEMALTGEARDRAGRKVVDTDGVDAFFQSIGLNPNVKAEASKKAWDVTEYMDYVKRAESNIVGRWARGVVDGDMDAIHEAQQELTEWNMRNPDSPIGVSRAQIMQRVQALRMERAGRIEKMAHRELRSRVRELMDEE